VTRTARAAAGKHVAEQSFPPEADTRRFFMKKICHYQPDFLSYIFLFYCIKKGGIY
jgi:hypothetical protein